MQRRRVLVRMGGLAAALFLVLALGRHFGLLVGG
jgi:hypothetical protein